MAERDDNAAAFRDLVPVNRLLPEAQRRLWQATTVRTIGVGQPVYLFGANDGLIHYLLKGDLDLIEQGRFVQRLRGGARAARRPLDQASTKRYTARGHSVCIIASVAHIELEREAESTRLPGAPGELAVSDLTHGEPVDSMTDIMRSALFQVLPTDAIQRLFGTLDPLDVHAEDTIVQQGEPGEYFYILARGYAEVARRRGQGRTDSHVSDLRPGNTFGEAALLSGYPRDANVTMLTDGRVLRLAKTHFDELIRGPLLFGIDAAEAVNAARAGSRWLDISDPEVYAKGPLRHSRNIPLNALRAQAPRLSRDERYIVCADDPALSAVGAFVLAECGFQVHYLVESILTLLRHDPALALYADSHTAQASNVVLFPSPPTANNSSASFMKPQGTAMDDRQNSASPIGAPEERVDRLYTQQEFAAALGAPAPAPNLAATQTGQSLARLIEDIDLRRAALAADSTLTGANVAAEIDSTSSEFIDFNVLEATAAPRATPATVLLDGPRLEATRSPSVAPTSTDDEMSAVMRDFERRLRNYVEANLIERTLDVERRYQEKAQRLQQKAANELRKRDAELRQRYATHYRQKEQQLRENYQKLTVLAQKISQQKAQLQQARTYYEDKIKAANAVYKQIADMRQLLGEQIGSGEVSGATARMSGR